MKSPSSQKIQIALWCPTLTVFLFALAALAACKKTPSLDNYGQVPEFDFTTHRNKSFTKQELLGHVNIANFIFTRCKTVCPVESLKMQRAVEATSSAPAIQHYSFSVDPTHDTPQVLAAFAKRYGDSPRWHFITGDSTEMRKTVEGALKISMEKRGDIDGVPDIVHGNHFMLIDGSAQIRGYYDSSDPGRMDQLAKDAMALQRVH